ncbi:hypothetical protein ACVIHI_001908 [Bradyrhizobium sp. USDA 4524]|uniref:hypothetical protein n=1 Tax=Bradyrhizobium TaxID=374 RepID=UPI00209F9272|nr:MULTISPECIES: hypothetical protein [Bradyrhizobium]MCP1845171.1 hypothetical protein [Bradyrhizobium sp. USDA 4538]MCP1905736.1 hypothetical protein [Bradyrhizobium sp. USDA 4537]MCP1988608.1 hypothetical protein [Bradyrhizobium sp. USDA 4539]MCP3418104.1 hypothetical protein [Bradyrhizobium brasilense]
MKSRVTFGLLLSALAVIGPARSGHESAVYPSFYPHEIEIRTVAPDAARALLLQSKIHAYLGNDAHFSDSVSDLSSVESLGSLVTVRINPQSSYAKADATVCAVARAVARKIASDNPDVILHPYPITPLHGDYLYHVDLAEAAKRRLLSDTEASPAFQELKLRAADTSTKRLLGTEKAASASDWDVEIREISLSELVNSATTVINGWLVPPQARSGWYQAYLVLHQAIDAGANERVEADVQRIQSGDFNDPVDRINLERAVVTALVSDCHQVIVGYTLRREYFNTEFSAGIENIAFDSLMGLNAPIFLRTVKLKDFPWNGWLRVGIDARPTSAWNPITGFSDPFGRLMWSAIADPALLPSPYDQAWMANRISEIQATPPR